MRSSVSPRLATPGRRRLVFACATTVAAALALGTTALAGVRVVDTLDLEEATRQGAIGLAVPGAGPTITRASALNTLLTGSVESSILGGTPTGTPRLTLDGAEPPDVLVTLPPTGRSRNDRRYPITVVGMAGGDAATADATPTSGAIASGTTNASGVLTSDSTRIVGLVSLADVANGDLRWVTVDDPVATLERLDDRIDRNARVRMPLTLTLVFLAAIVGWLAPRWGPRLALIALAANLWLAGWWVVALATLAALVLPLGAACAAIVVAYLAVLGLDPEAIALSPFGPSQAGRFYGLSNLLSTWLLLPALLGAALLRRAGVVVAVLALVAVGGNRFGADGGGLLVLLAGYGALLLRMSGVRLGAARLAMLGAAAVATGMVLVGLDAALGGSSHVTTALGDGPGAVASDVLDRLELSARRATGSAGAIAATLAGLAGLAAVGTRRPRTPVTDAMLVAVGVSLLVNDTPTDVAAVGATVAYLVRRYETSSPSLRPVRLDRLRAMRRTTIAASSLLAALALAVAGCTGGEEVGATPETVEGDVPTQVGPDAGELPALELEGDAANGEALFTANGCGACHTLAAANASGTVGPNLDQAKPSSELAVERLTLGQGGMPAFGDKLSAQEIADLAAYVSESAGG